MFLFTAQWDYIMTKKIIFYNEYIFLIMLEMHIFYLLHNITN